MASSSPKKPAIKPMFFKRKDLSKPKPTLLPVAKPTPIDDPIESASGAKASAAPKSPDIIEIIDDVKDEKKLKLKQKGSKAEKTDLDYWGRSRHVHDGMMKLERERHRKEKEAEDRRKQKEAAELERQKKEEKQNTRSSKRRKSGDNEIIQLSDDENDGDENRHRKFPRDGTVTPTTSTDALDNAEFEKILAEYKKKKEAEDAAAAKSTQESFTEPISTQHLTNSQRATSTDPGDAYKDVIIQILIVSRIDGTKPFVYNRKFSQTLGKVRDTWARMNHLTEEQVDRLIFVWQNETRVFDSTVPRSLGIRFDREGKMYVEEKNRRKTFGRRDRDEKAALQEGIAPGECKIFFDAMWAEDFEQMLKEREEAQANEEKEIWGITEIEEEEVVTGITPNTKPMFITLRGKNFKELKLKVKPTMKVSEVIQKMKKERDLDDDTEIELHFDGDELEENMTLEDAEIEHEFQIDVVLQ
ncbi:hypothetical protein H072_9314 [Dactylellina haptotyla CBS 200.50]|uniref:Ubiquitin-like domain-containing protein n=1 Tax=Dactylellina haptotyla (strain CBS 200.50) TaxID=1284197 RepID=S8BCY1_DACHA|nr:hypothetical protein H072_9314 [Dactylellina haptotyla CBS 200.50]